MNIFFNKLKKFVERESGARGDGEEKKNNFYTLSAND